MKEHLSSIFYMFILTLFFASVVTGVKNYNAERIELNQQAKLKKIILGALGLPVSGEEDLSFLVSLFDRAVKTIRVNDKTVYVAYESDGKRARGYAFEVSGPGFWGPIDAIVAVDSNAERLLGVRFYNHVETPGLGARISEPWFAKQFVALPIDAAGEGQKVFHLRQRTTGELPNELNAITGATMTSQAVEAFLNRELLRFVRETRDLLREE